MKKIIISIYLVIFSVLTFIFFVVKDTFDIEKFSLILNILTTTQIFVTFFIAYLVYDRFGTSRKLLDKQNEIAII